MTITAETITEFYGSCKTCESWVTSQNNPSLKICAGDNGCQLTGENFFCANYKRAKHVQPKRRS